MITSVSMSDTILVLRDSKYFFNVLVFGVAAINTSISSGFKFPDVENNRAIGDETIEIPQSVFATSTGQLNYEP